jgi:hypothetical protein
MRLSLGREANNRMLVLSNLAYLIPVAVVGRNMYSSAKMNHVHGATLILLFLYITFVSSWSYHECRAEFVVDDGFDSSSEYIDPGSKCSSGSTVAWMGGLPGSEGELTFQLSQYLDHLVAVFTLFMVLIHVVTMDSTVRKLSMVASLLWIATFLSVENSMFAVLPIFVALLAFLSFWYVVSAHQTANYRRKRFVAWGLASISLALALVFFQLHDEPYWLHHSLWHIFGALGAAFILSRSADCYQEINTRKVKLQNWMVPVFDSPAECAVLPGA